MPLSPYLCIYSIIYVRWTHGCLYYGLYSDIYLILLKLIPVWVLGSGWDSFRLTLVPFCFS